MLQQFASNSLKVDIGLQELALEDDNITDKSKIFKLFK